MKNMMITLMLLLLFSSVSFAAMDNLIYDGGFDSGVLNSVSSSDLSFTSDELNQWYTFNDWRGDFYRVTDEGYVTANTERNWGRLLVQIVEAPEAGEYNFDFDYRLTDNSGMFSVVRVFGIEDDDAAFSIGMSSWNYPFANVNAETRIYDQGGFGSRLPSAPEWTHVSSSVNVSQSMDYLVIYAAFSHDGSVSSLENEFADLDNFSLTFASVGSQGVPEPTTIAILGLGGFFLLKTKRA